MGGFRFRTLGILKRDFEVWTDLRDYLPSPHFFNGEKVPKGRMRGGVQRGYSIELYMYFHSESLAYVSPLICLSAFVVRKPNRWLSKGTPQSPRWRNGEKTAHRDALRLR
jgi:hypothetical protein